MKQRVLLILGRGSWHEGFASVTLQLWEEGSRTSVQFSGSLPAAPELHQTFQQWQFLYNAVYNNCNSHQRATHLSTIPLPAVRSLKTTQDSSNESVEGDELELETGGVTHVSVTEFLRLGEYLSAQFNNWLEAPTFRALDRRLRTHLALNDEIRLILTAENKTVLSGPWHLWQLLEDYPRAELALGSIDYQRSIKQSRTEERPYVSVLAVLGDARGIDVKTDRQLLADLPGAIVTLLVEPSLEDLHHQLWQGTWDVLFFAGHSASKAQGILQLSPAETITVSQLKYALRTAIAKGLQLAIFNSCDGLGLAWDLADLHIPQVIVMREPVADPVAQAFLKHFLIAFAAEQPLYLAVRAAREQLQPLESRYPYATWLPVIVQNPAELPPSWRRLQGRSDDRGESDISLAVAASASAQPTTFPIRHQVQRSLWIPLLTTAAVSALRLFGVLMAVELSALDWLIRLRPAEQRDPRFLVVTIGEADIRTQSPERKGSLSDQALDHLLVVLEQQQARLVGLDIYRDYPASSAYPALAERLQTGDRLVGVCKSLDPTVDDVGVDPPPELAEAFVGFSDFLDDADGIVRRHLVALEADPASTCTTPYAFSARLAFLYLQDEGITPSYDASGNLVMGEVIFPRLRPRSGGYQSIDAGGNQILLNYRALPAPSKIAEQVSLNQVLAGRVNPQAIAGRIVLIGVTASSLTDDWATPYGQGGTDKTPGVFLQAQMASQLISAALGERPVLQVWPLWREAVWIGSWAVAGWAVGIGASRANNRANGRLRWEIIFLGSGILLLTGSSLWLLTVGYWVPLVPAGLAFVGSRLGEIGQNRWSRPT